MIKTVLGLESLLGENVALCGSDVIYKGKLVAVYDTCVLLAEPRIKSVVGPPGWEHWKEEPLPHSELYVMLTSIHSLVHDKRQN